MDNNIKTEKILVETVSSFLLRYVIEVPVGNHKDAVKLALSGDKDDNWQQHLGEQLLSYRVVNDDDEISELTNFNTNYTNIMKD